LGLIGLLYFLYILKVNICCCYFLFGSFRDFVIKYFSPTIIDSKRSRKKNTAVPSLHNRILKDFSFNNFQNRGSLHSYVTIRSKMSDIVIFLISQAE
jgi:hypothetical protein